MSDGLTYNYDCYPLGWGAGAGCFWILGAGAGAGADREKNQEPEPLKKISGAGAAKNIPAPRR